MEVKGKGYGV